MAFLSDIDKKLSELGQGAIKKTKNVSDSVRITALMKEEEGRQKDFFRYIGEYYYRTYSSQAEGQLKEWCEQVRRSQDMIQQYQEQLKVLKGVTYCPNCNAEVPVTSVFCSNCGSKMMVQQAPPAVSGKSCPACGALVEDDQVFCTNCGNRIPESVPVEMPVPVQKVCPNCGKELKEGQMFCTGCGTKL